MSVDVVLLKKIVEQNTTFVLTTHVNPDGDGIGSELALARFLRKQEKNVSILNYNKTPDNYEWLDVEKDITQFAEERDQSKILQADVIIILDTNQPERLRTLQPYVERSKATKVVIDHHLDAHPFAKHYFIDEDATSTGEIVYKIINELDDKAFDKDIARALYAAIMTDTGSFRYPRTDPETHRITAHLIECGADPTEIFANIFENWSAGRIKLLGSALNSLKTTHNGKLAYIVCTQKMFNETETTEIETDNFTTYPMSVSGVQIGILFNELDNGVKISFRSKGKIPINELAKEFGGNGHLNAAGVRLHNVKLDDIVKSVLEKAWKYLSNQY